jgi:hypothetical protein
MRRLYYSCVAVHRRGEDNTFQGSNPFKLNSPLWRSRAEGDLRYLLTISLVTWEEHSLIGQTQEQSFKPRWRKFARNTYPIELSCFLSSILQFWHFFHAETQVIKSFNRVDSAARPGWGVYNDVLPPKLRVFPVRQEQWAFDGGTGKKRKQIPQEELMEKMHNRVSPTSKLTSLPISTLFLFTVCQVWDHFWSWKASAILELKLSSCLVFWFLALSMIHGLHSCPPTLNRGPTHISIIIWCSRTNLTPCL